jgi:hypothetical protein
MKSVLKTILFACLIALGARSQAQTVQPTEISKNGKPHIAYTYDAQNRCTAEREFPKNAQAETTQYSYTGDNKLHTILKTDTTQTTEWEIVFTYKTGTKPESYEKTRHSKIVESGQFRYDKKGILLGEISQKITKKGKRKTIEIEYEWKNGDITKRSIYETSDEIRDLRETTVYTYDTNPNPFLGIDQSIKSLSQHNILTKDTRDRFGMVVTDETYSQTYTYDAKQRPTTIQRYYASGKGARFEIKYQQ